jgi:hypothetical protein
MASRLVTLRQRRLSLLILVILCCPLSSVADFGIPRRQQQQGREGEIDSATVDVDGDMTRDKVTDNELVFQLQQHTTTELDEMVHKIAKVIATAQDDPETSRLLQRMRQQDDFASLQKDLTPAQIVSGLVDTLREMEQTNQLYSENPAQAVQDLERQGRLPPHRVTEYRDNPQLLVDDTNKALYFTFISYAAAGGYLQ